ncbi:MAG: hypothetical protein COV73_04255, partial [Candidatus Omnitrophica bacterium CG11_big_fil_rev_8_21_14_0_20_43_6]
QNGFLANPFSVESICQQLELAAGIRQDPSLVTAITKEARRTVSIKYGIDNSILILTGLYRKIHPQLMPPESTIAITGSTSGLGLRLISRLRQKSRKIIAFTRNNEEGKRLVETMDNGSLEWVPAETLCSLPIIKRLIQGSHTLCHLAAVKRADFSKNPAYGLAINGFLVGVMAELIKQEGREEELKFIFASSQEVYTIGNQNDRVCDPDEDMAGFVELWLEGVEREFYAAFPGIISGEAGDFEKSLIDFTNYILNRYQLPLPGEGKDSIDLYALSKLLAERFLKSLPHAIILRISNLYGLGYKGERTLPKFITAIKNVEEVIVDSKERRDFVYVEDAAEIFEKVAAMQIEGCQIANLASGEVISLGQVIQLIRAATKPPRVKVKTVPAQKGFRPTRFDNRFAKIILGRAFTLFSDGLEEYMHWLYLGELEQMQYASTTSTNKKRSLSSDFDVVHIPGMQILSLETGGGSASATFLGRMKGRLVCGKICNWEGVDGNGWLWLIRQMGRIEWLRASVPEQAKDLLPEIIQKSDDPGMAYYLMNFWKGRTLTKYLLSELNATPEGLWKRINIILDKLTAYVYPIGHVQAAAGYSQKAHIDRMERRLKIMTERRGDTYERLIRGQEIHFGETFPDITALFSKLLRRKTISINGKAYLNLPVMINMLKRHPELLRRLEPKFIYKGWHGDLIITNMFEDELGELHLLDWRGTDIPDEPGDIAYDLGKLLFSLSGFDLVRANLFTMDLSPFLSEDLGSFEFSFDTDQPAVQKYLDAYVLVLRRIKEDPGLNGLLKDDPHWQERMLLAEAAGFVADIPCRLESHPWRHSLAFYLIGVIKLHDFLVAEGFLKENDLSDNAGVEHDISPGVLDDKIILRLANVYDETTGGKERHLQSLNRELLQRNKLTIIQMYLTTNPENNKATIQTIGKGRLIRVPVTNKMGETVEAKAKEIFRQYPVDLVIMHSLGLYQENLALIKMAKDFSIPCVVQNHGSNIHLNEPLVRRFLSEVEGVVGVNGMEVPEDLQGKFKSLYNGIDTVFFDISKSDLRRVAQIKGEEDIPIILLQARVERDKGHLDLIKMAHRIIEKEGAGLRFKIICVGQILDSDVEYKKEVLSLASKYRVDIYFTGRVSQEEMRDYYTATLASGGVVVLPSKTEGLPRAILEAAAIGNAVVAYDVGGVSEAMESREEERTGYLIKYGDINAFADAIILLLKDEEKLKEIRRRARIFVVTNFSLSALAKRHEAYYLEIIDNNRRIIGRETKDWRNKSTDSIQSSYLIKLLEGRLNAGRRSKPLRLAGALTTATFFHEIGNLVGSLGWAALTGNAPMVYIESWWDLLGGLRYSGKAPPCIGGIIANLLVFIIAITLLPQISIPVLSWYVAIVGVANILHAIIDIYFNLNNLSLVQRFLFWIERLIDEPKALPSARLFAAIILRLIKPRARAKEAVPAEVDLHLVSIYSSGSQTPSGLIYEAYRKGLRAVSLCDITFDGIREALKAGDIFSVEVIPAIQFPTSEKGVSITLYIPDKKHLLEILKHRTGEEFIEKTLQVFLRSQEKIRLRIAEAFPQIPGIYMTSDRISELVPEARSPRALLRGTSQLAEAQQKEPPRGCLPAIQPVYDRIEQGVTQCVGRPGLGKFLGQDFAPALLEEPMVFLLALAISPILTWTFGLPPSLAPPLSYAISRFFWHLLHLWKAEGGIKARFAFAFSQEKLLISILAIVLVLRASDISSPLSSLLMLVTLVAPIFIHTSINYFNSISSGKKILTLFGLGLAFAYSTFRGWWGIILGAAGGAAAIFIIIIGFIKSLVLFIKVARHPRVEIINRQRLKGFVLKVLFWDFDGTIWIGYPYDKEAELLAEWIGLNLTDAKNFMHKMTTGFTMEEREEPLINYLKEHGLIWKGHEAYASFIEDFWAAIDKEIENKGLATTKFLIPGIAKFMQIIQEKGIIQTVVTGAKAESRSRTAQAVGVAKYLKALYGDGQKDIKIKDAFSEWGFATSQAALIGDGVVDIVAALKAGVLAIGIAFNSEHRQRLINAGADIIINGDYRNCKELLEALNISDEQAGKSSASTRQGSLVNGLIVAILGILGFAGLQLAGAPVYLSAISLDIMAAGTILFTSGLMGNLDMLEFIRRLLRSPPALFRAAWNDPDPIAGYQTIANLKGDIKSAVETRSWNKLLHLLTHEPGHALGLPHPLVYITQALLVIILVPAIILISAMLDINLLWRLLYISFWRADPTLDYKERSMLKPTKDNLLSLAPIRNILIVSARLKEEDGVTLETFKQIYALLKLGYNIFVYAGEVDWQGLQDLGVPREQIWEDANAYFQWDLIEELGARRGSLSDHWDGWAYSTSSRGVLKGAMKHYLLEFVEKRAAPVRSALVKIILEHGIDALFLQNASLPWSIHLGAAVSELTLPRIMPINSHNHDFAQQRDYWRINKSRDLIPILREISQMFCPPDSSATVHAIINSLSVKALPPLAVKEGRYVYLPNVFWWGVPEEDLPIGIRRLENKHLCRLRKVLKLEDNDVPILLPVRVIERKDIISSVEIAHFLAAELETYKLHPVLILTHAANEEGDEYVSQVKQRADELGVDIRFVQETLLKDKDFSPLHVYQLPNSIVMYLSIVEGFGNALLEAIYFRRPVILRPYSVAKQDILPLGIHCIEYDPAGLTDADSLRKLQLRVAQQMAEEIISYREIGTWTEQTRMDIEKNYEICTEHFSMLRLTQVLQEIIAKMYKSRAVKWLILRAEQLQEQYPEPQSAEEVDTEFTERFTQVLADFWKEIPSVTINGRAMADPEQRLALTMEVSRQIDAKRRSLETIMHQSWEFSPQPYSRPQQALESDFSSLQVYDNPVLEIPLKIQAKMRELISYIWGDDNQEVVYQALVFIMQEAYKRKTPELMHRDGEFDPVFPWSEQDLYLICYADHIKSGNGKSPLMALGNFLRQHYPKERYPGLVIHLLPFYVSPRRDGGFDVEDPFKVHGDLGSWEDIAYIAQKNRLAFDFVANHMSRECRWFNEFLAGDKQAERFFIVFNEDNPEQMRQLAQIRQEYQKLIYRPRPHDPFIRVQKQEGTFAYVYMTFSDYQPDLNYANPEVFIKMAEILLYYVLRGAGTVRLDAIPYLWKEWGTSCVHHDKTHKLVELFRVIKDVVAPSTILLSESMEPPLDSMMYLSTNSVKKGSMGYNFLPCGLIPHTMITGDATKFMGALKYFDMLPLEVTWAVVCGKTHDGTSANPCRAASASQDQKKKEMLLQMFTQEQIEELGMAVLTEEEINVLAQYYTAMGLAQAPGDFIKEFQGRYAEGPRFANFKSKTDENGNQVNIIYELISTYASLFHGDVDKIVAALTMAMPLKGIPFIYFTALLGALNDYELYMQTKNPRELNRGRFDAEDLESALRDSNSLTYKVFTRMQDLMLLRTTHLAFHPAANQQAIATGNNKVFSLLRTSPDGQERIVALHNVSDQEQHLEGLNLGSFMPGARVVSVRDIITQPQVAQEIPVAAEGIIDIILKPYQIAWLKVEVTQQTKMLGAHQALPLAHPELLFGRQVSLLDIGSDGVFLSRCLKAKPGLKRAVGINLKGQPETNKLFKFAKNSKGRIEAYCMDA